MKRSPFRRVFCVKQNILKVFSENSLPFAAISGGTMNDPDRLVAFLFYFSSWMKAWEMILIVNQIIRAEGRVKPLLLLGLRISPLHNLINTDWESKFLPGLEMVNVPCITAFLAPW